MFYKIKEHLESFEIEKEMVLICYISIKYFFPIIAENNYLGNFVFLFYFYISLHCKLLSTF